MKHKNLKIETTGSWTPNYYKGIWMELMDGGSDQWLYVVRQGLTYIFIEILDMPAYCGGDARELWCAQVDVVDIGTASPETIVGAMKCCGCDNGLDLREESDRLRLAEMMHSYGAKSPMWSGSSGEPKFDDWGNVKNDYDQNSLSFRSLRKEAREAAEELFDDEYREQQLDSRIVNKIGQTAREFADGTNGLWESLRRIQADPNASDEQKLVLKMYGACEQTLGAGPVPEDLRNEPKVTVRKLKQSDIEACKFLIFAPEHYRENGSCRCDDPEHRKMMIAKWGYSEKDFEEGQ